MTVYYMLGIAILSAVEMLGYICDVEIIQVDNTVIQA